jgi:hypothetical protein
MLPNEAQIPDTTLAATGLSRGLSPFVGRPRLAGRNAGRHSQVTSTLSCMKTGV